MDLGGMRVRIEREPSERPAIRCEELGFCARA